MRMPAADDDSEQQTTATAATNTSTHGGDAHSQEASVNMKMTASCQEGREETEEAEATYVGTDSDEMHDDCEREIVQQLNRHNLFGEVAQNSSNSTREVRSDVVMSLVCA